MIKLLIVDDEVLVRIGIKTMLNWEENGYTVVGEASDGREALDKIISCVPDIVLTDLKMDGMDGFELIRFLRENYPSIKIVVLSCYNDFENVREAMKLGACDYIFKLTIRADELLKVLDSIRSEISVQSSPRGLNASKSERIVLKNINVIKSSMIKSAAERSYVTKEDFIREWKELGIRVSLEEEYVVLYISIDDYYLLNLSSKIQEKELLAFSLQNIMDEVLKKQYTVEVINYEEGDSVTVFNTYGKSYEEMVLSIRESFDIIRELVKRYIGISISAGLSKKASGIASLSGALKEANAGMGLRFFRGGGGLHTLEDIEAGIDDPNSDDVSLDSSRLSDLVEYLDEESLKNYMTEFIGRIRRSKGITVEKVRSLMHEALYHFVSKARLRGVQVDDIKSDCGFTPYQAVAGYDTIDRLEDWFKWFIEQYVALCRRKTENRGREEIIRIKAYVRENIGKEIDVPIASAYVNMGESYFSHIFKKEAGISFVDYVNGMKVEKAKELLLQTNYKIYEIASMVGFENANYFSMLFKKTTGISPNDYRFQKEFKNI